MQNGTGELNMTTMMTKGEPVFLASFMLPTAFSFLIRYNCYLPLTSRRCQKRFQLLQFSSGVFTTYNCDPNPNPQLFGHPSTLVLSCIPLPPHACTIILHLVTLVQSSGNFCLNALYCFPPLLTSYRWEELVKEQVGVLDDGELDVRPEDQHADVLRLVGGLAPHYRRRLEVFQKTRQAKALIRAQRVSQQGRSWSGAKGGLRNIIGK